MTMKTYAMTRNKNIHKNLADLAENIDNPNKKLKEKLLTGPQRKYKNKNH